jgi:hypothetical protein
MIPTELIKIAGIKLYTRTHNLIIKVSEEEKNA